MVNPGILHRSSATRSIMPITVFRVWVALTAAAVCLTPLYCPAQAPATPTNRAGPNDWPLESLVTHEGQTYRGYVQSTAGREIEFVEVVRPPGKDMYLVVHTFPANQVASVSRFPDDQHEEIVARVEQFRLRSLIEAGDMEAVQLIEPMDSNGLEYLYQGQWFDLRSTSDAETTRRAIVRVEQFFRAFRLVFPPRREPGNHVRIVLYGSMDEYRKYLRDNDLQIDHSAFFAPKSNAVVAGADLTMYAHLLRQARQENNEVREQYKSLDGEFKRRQQEWRSLLLKNGFTNEQIAAELRVREKAWKDEFSAKMTDLDAIDRRNEDRFGEFSQRVFARLRHEAFHAYVENYLYPQSEYALPRWLNEGLAQVFETARMDGSALRIDAPDRETLLKLQQDLRGGAPLRLADLLASDEQSFLAMHDRVGDSQQRYLYSWGLAWSLLSRTTLLNGEALTAYVTPTAGAPSPIERFEPFVRTKLPDFEREWREAMLALRPAAP
jgi:hypothetical protein